MLYDTPFSVAKATAACATHDDDIIPVVTGITLIDADSGLIAGQLRHRSWADRAQYLNNIVAHSLLRQARMLDYAHSKEAGAAFSSWAVTEMQRKIGEVVELWGAAKPVDADAAGLFRLSLNPRHRRAAEAWVNTNEKTFESFDLFLQDRWVALAALAQLSTIADIDAAEAWRTGPGECSDDWFDLPGWVA